MNWYENFGITKPYYADDAVCIVHADCRDILPLIPDKSIDLVLTSPPYWDLHKYSDQEKEIGFGQSLKTYLAAIENCFHQLYPLLKDDANVWFNIMDCWRDGNLIPLGDLIIKSSPMNLVEKVIWYIPNKMPIVNERHLVNKFEWLLHFKKSDGYYFNADVLRLPRSEWAEKDKRTWKYNLNGALLGNVWEIPAIHIPNPEHPAMFPQMLANRCISGWTKTENLILDPFLGSGTTAYCAKKLGRKCIGIEIEEKYCEIAAKRCSQMVMQLEQ